MRRTAAVLLVLLAAACNGVAPPADAALPACAELVCDRVECDAGACHCFPPAELGPTGPPPELCVEHSEGGR